MPPTQQWIHAARITVVAIMAMVVLIGNVACRSNSTGTATPSRQGAITLNGAGATFPYPLYAKWISAYKEVKSEVNINYQSIGSGGGIKELRAGTVDFGASDAPLSPEEEAQMPAPVYHLPTAAGAVVVAYHLPDVASGLRLTPEALSGIYLGEITKWNDKRLTAINPGVKLPNLAIAVVNRSDGSGTTYLFTSYLAAVSKTWANKVGAGKSVSWPVGIGGKGNEGVAGVLKQTPGSIGYIELAYAEQNNLSYAAVRNRAGSFVTPGIDSTKAAVAGASESMKKDVRASIVNAPGKDAYPISGLTYILVYQQQKDAAKGTALVDFLRWAMHDGQQYAADLQYAPLPDAVVALNDAKLDAMTAGDAASAPAAK